VLFIEPNKEHTHAVFAQLRMTPQLLPNTHLAAGLRFNAPEGGTHSTIWNVSGQYDLPADWFVKATVGTHFRLPSAEELFADDPQDERGDRNLRPERTRSANASIGGSALQSQLRLTWELIGFVRDIRDLIDCDAFDDTTGQCVFENTPGSVKVRGAALDLGASIADYLAIQASYEMNQSRLDDGNQVTRVPLQVGKADLDFHPAGLPVGATLSVSYIGSVDAAVGGDRIADH
jgi:outer membrane cobalamin receptor